ncbi:DUF2461 domain-containing protein [Prolixibacteraceae bacterium]|nr:DUF2461 domain-containing protein [Prolixibacteraceae bacterium]
MDTKFIYEFLVDLQQNNSRKWMTANKSRYERAKAEFMRLTDEVIVRTNQFDPTIGSLEAKDCIFRIHRDVRFSHDKTPYKRSMGAYVVCGGKKSMKAGYYFQIEPGGQILVAGGLHRPPSDALKLVRKHISEFGDELINIIEAPTFKEIFPRGLEGESLKRFPKGYSADNPYVEILKKKEFDAIYYCDEDMVNDTEMFLNKIVSVFKEIVPLNRFINEALEEYVFIPPQIKKRN